MATITGTHVNFVKVPTTANFTDIDPKVDGTIYFIVDAKKIYLDGVMYGFNDSDVAGQFLELSGGKMTGTLNMNNKILDHANNIRFVRTVDGDHHSGITATLGRVSINVVENSDPYNPVESEYKFVHNLFTIPNVKITGVADGSANTDAVTLGQLNSLVVNKIGVADGIATLDEGGKVPSTQLPSYVDDIVEYANKASFPATGESAKLYVDLDTTYLWRWSGSAYINVSDGNAPLKLGSTESTAYRGDRGTTAYNHTLLTQEQDNPHNITKAKVGLPNLENYGIATTVEAEEGNVNNKYMTPLRVKEAVEELAPKLAWTVVS